MSRASLRNEGKIHLGTIYANEATAATALLQLRAALRFRGLLRRWLGEAVDGIRTSTPFDYVVATDSLVSPAALAAFYARIETAYREEIAADPALDYLGHRPDRLFTIVSPDEAARYLAPGSFQAVFRTAERSIDTDDLASRIRAAIAAAPGIRFLGGHEVRGFSGGGGGLVVEGRVGAASFAVAAEQVVNATWERRHAIDRAFGLPVVPGVLHRLKYRVIARLPEALRGAPSATMVLGRYGDVVVRHDTVYLSWYPAGLRGWSADIEPPRDWDAACRGEPPPGVAADVAHGHSDVDDPASGLHGRTRVGIVSQGSYHSVDPGKLTTAPLFGLEVAERVDRMLRGGS